MKNKLFLIGIGPGGIENMTIRAYQCIQSCEVLAGYTVYIEQVKELCEGKRIIQKGMGQEIERCKLAIEEALTGSRTAIVCSGDASLYGMAGLTYELLHKLSLTDEIDVEVIPGITSATSCSSLLGAPIVEDFCTISLSDYMVDWEKILCRLEKAAEADFTIALYNPKSKARPGHLKEAVERLLKHRNSSTPVGIVRNAYREEQNITLTTLGDLDYEMVDMFCTLIIGNSSSYIQNGKMITPRGYKL